MYKLIRHPLSNAVGISVFSLFYTAAFCVFADRIGSQDYFMEASPFWRAWDSFLYAGGQRAIACVLLLLTVLAVALLLIRHKPYDEYHTAILIKCLVVALLLTLAAIAAFFVVVLLHPTEAIGAVTFFVSLNWATVVLADLVYLILCGRK